MKSASPRWWRLAAADRRWVVASGASLAILLGAAALAGWRQGSATREARLALAEAQRQRDLASEQAAAKASAQTRAPWWATIPGSPAGGRSTAEQLSADALALGPKLGVQVQRLAFGAPTRADGAPYHSTSVQAEVRGTYADVKRWISELLARQPRSLALKRLDIRRTTDAGLPGASAQPGSIVASIEWRWFERRPQL